MKKILYTLALAAALTSCVGSYNVEGSSSITALDGSKLYLKAIKNNQLKNLDSCEVVHGEFHFSGTLDSIRMASLYMDDESVMPIVLEKGDIVVKIEAGRQIVSGTPLNDSLYVFIEEHNRLSNQMNELSHKQSQMLLDGIDEAAINEQLSVEAAKIASDEDRLVTKFIEANFDNVLGPGVFMMITSQYRYPILTPQIEDLMSKATKVFKEDPYVKNYYKTAQENEQRMNGLEEAPTPPAPPASQQPSARLTTVPQK
ncbi:DUF4369 domain-containing protein [Prevotella brevis]|uniref:DUF4369 domain-containing protein n=1 Tax=Xylanibacter brevis TaxID=83231 RepID=A0ABS9CCI3_9BACT|nr:MULTISPECIES: DUF4369 domain-containing protein [Prevotellaceae]MCF2559260.1 DUF4369 domain-containing protein [Xylanibacter brevis]MCF2562826.1 DUF4369 domain-containing protein [Xylanibacter brevis]OYP39761.1 hypothetical protein CIK88_10705 [Prevotella sp. P5-50]OYP46311.1 hypothetical protein CIK89_01355 [Prevotella sp. P4-119]